MSQLAKRVIRGIRHAKEVFIHRWLSPSSIRKRGLRREVGFWDEWLASHGASWREDFESRLNNQIDLRDHEVVRAIDDLSAPEVSLLDVGAGPLTYLSGTHPRAEVTITAVDPLADEYRELLRKHGISSSVVPLSCPAEGLVEHFAPHSFDITYARNSLDHALNAPLAVVSMFEVTKPGGWVILRHHPHEGKTRSYQDLHAWNFEARSGCVYLENRDISVNLSKLFEHRAVIEFREETEKADDGHVDWIVFAMKKLPRVAEKEM